MFEPSEDTNNSQNEYKENTMEMIKQLETHFMDVMNSGGPIMWVILSVAILAMILLSWQSLNVMSLNRNAKRDYQRLSHDATFVPSSETTHSNSPIAQLMDKVDWQAVENKDDVTKEMNIHIADIMPKLNNGLSTIGTLGSILPMLGLLGTVTGMINVFEVIAIQGSGDADAMAGGISQALLTTASGLIIAIPVIFCHHLLANRVNALMDITGQAMQVVLHRDISLFRTNLNVNGKGAVSHA